MTFNPNLDWSAGEINPFDDLREIKKAMIAAGHKVEQENGDESDPASFELIDPDGNSVLIDQHR